MVISHKIREIRDNNKLSQKRFGEKLGLSGKTISAYETGKCKPPLKVLERMSKVYEVTFVHLKSEKKQELEKKLSSVRSSLDEIEELVKEGLTM